MLDDLIRIHSTAEFRQDGSIDLSVTLDFLKRQSREPSTHSASSREEHDRQAIASELTKAFDVAAHLEASQWHGHYDLSKITEDTGRRADFSWMNTVDSIVRKGCEWLEEEKGWTVLPMLTYLDHSPPKPGGKWTTVLRTDFKFSSGDKPKYHDIDLENFNKWNAQEETQSDKSLDLAVKFCQKSLKSNVPLFAKIQVPSCIMRVSYPETDGEYIQDIDNLVFDFESSTSRYGSHRFMKEEHSYAWERRDWALSTKGALELAALSRKFQCNDETRDVKSFYSKDDLETILNVLTSLNGVTKQPGRTLSYIILTEDEDRATSSMKSPLIKVSEEVEDRIAWKDLDTKHEGIPTAVNSENIQSLVQVGEKAQQEFAHISTHGDDHDYCPADWIGDLYEQGPEKSKLKAHTLLCKSILSEVAKSSSRSEGTI
ncbi:hypothetical protein I302_106906 [Kwoniella bestiolae CBS 10118]|uniref:Uncharacterized protein n=1 Tax=Kwoniella bestiolae CBS 10118 TaxID=1296100 RepID=A0A1B9G024_9TREE|nr:hypothetical protein I302_05828 [Kwoniella bestiolae CBS 10118]OCF24368.1 hypothetical protein I302_05828 [Kwoniella bestiolae CBS 10118]